MSVGVMKDYKLKLRNLHVPHTLGWSWKRMETKKRKKRKARGTQVRLEGTRIVTRRKGEGYF